VKKSNVKENNIQFQEPFSVRLKKDLKRNRNLYIMIIPIVLFYLIFHYKPMYGALIAFKNYIPSRGFLGSEWVGFKYFSEFLQSHYFWRILRNTLTISISNLIFGFPAPLIFALLLNEIGSTGFKKTVQTITYLPHFISMVVICGMIKTFTMDTGIINYFVELLGGTRATMLNEPSLFVPIYVLSSIWQDIGWGSIIYIAAIAGIDPTLYEAAQIDGASRLRQVWSVTIPGILPTVTVLLILRIGNLLSVGYEKVILLYNPAIYETADVISSFVYRKGLMELNWSYSSAVGLLNSVINCILLFAANFISNKLSDTALW